jgi:hypothetical protein
VPKFDPLQSRPASIGRSNLSAEHTSLQSGRTSCSNSPTAMPLLQKFSCCLSAKKPPVTNSLGGRSASHTGVSAPCAADLGPRQLLMSVAHHLHQATSQKAQLYQWSADGNYTHRSQYLTCLYSFATRGACAGTLGSSPGAACKPSKRRPRLCSTLQPLGLPIPWLCSQLCNRLCTSPHIYK